MEHALVEVLVATLNADVATRRAAEAALENGAAQKGFGVALARVALAPDLSYGIRQLAALLLKRYVKHHWQEEGEEDALPPQACDDDKAAIRALLPAGLADAEGKIRTAVGMAIAAIARWDWPASWPDLMATLVTGVRQRSSRPAVQGALRCLSLVAEHLDDAHLPTLVPQLWPPLHALVAARNDPGQGVPQPASGDGDSDDDGDGDDAPRELARRALGVVGTCLGTLAVMAGVYRRQTAALLAPTLPAWLQQLGEIMAEGATLAARSRSTGRPARSWALPLCAARLCTQLASSFPGLCVESLPQLLPPAWALLTASAERYETIVVHGPAEGESPAADSDGGDIGFETLACQLLELLLAFVGAPRLRGALHAAAGPMVAAALTLSQMTSAQAATWASDPNAYVADEDDDACSARAGGEMLADEIVGAYGDAGLSAVVGAACSALDDPGSTWQRREAALLLLSSVATPLVASVVAGSSTCPLDLGTFLGGLLRRDILPAMSAESATYAGAAFLAGQALWTAAQLAGGVPPAIVTQVAMASASVVAAPHTSAPLRIGALRALARLAPTLPPEALATVSGQLYGGLTSLLAAGASEETLHLLLNAAAAALEATTAARDAAAGGRSPGSADLPPPPPPALAAPLLAAWACHVTDPLLSGDASAAIVALAACGPIPRDAVLASLVPACITAFASPASQPPQVVEAALCLVGDLLRGPAAVSARAIHDHLFPSIACLACTWGGGDPTIAAAAASTLAASVRAGGEPLLSWGPGSPGDVLATLVTTTASLLAPGGDDLGARSACDLAGQLVIRAASHLAPVASPLVAALATRLDAAAPMTAISLVTCLSRLVVCCGPTVVMAALAGATLLDGRPALSPTLATWADRQSDVHGRRDATWTAVALAALLAAGHDALTSATVRGRLLPAAASAGAAMGRVTRARARAMGPDTWTAVPLGAKILGAVADAVIAAHAEAEADVGSGSDEYDTDEGDDAPAGDASQAQQAGGSSAEAAPGGRWAVDDDDGDGDEGDDFSGAVDPLAGTALGPHVARLLRECASRDRASLDAWSVDLTAPQRAALAAFL